MATEKKIKTKKLGSQKQPTKSEKGKYRIEVNVNDLIYKGKAPDLAQALQDFISSPVFPSAFKTRLLLKYGIGTIERQRVLYVPEARRTFNVIAIKPVALELLAEQMTRELA